MSHVKSLMGKRALVSGGSRGIGAAIVLELARRGCDVVFTYIVDEKSAQKTQEEAKKFGVRCMSIRCDVSKEDEVIQCIEKVAKEFSQIDFLVNNAGIAKDRTVKNLSLEDWNSVMSTNLAGTFLMTKHSMPILSDKGSIVNISSVVGIEGNIGQANYAASKAGVIAFTKTLAKEMAKRRIRANVVAPGFIETDMMGLIPSTIKEEYLKKITLGTVGSPNDVANAVVFLLSDDARYITGQVIRVDGGISL